MSQHRLVASLALVGLIALIASPARSHPVDPPSVEVAGGCLLISLPEGIDRCALEVEPTGLTVRWRGGQRLLSRHVLGGLREVRSTTRLRVTGGLQVTGPLRLSAPRLEVAGVLRASRLDLRALGWLEVEAGGSLAGGSIELSADVLSLVGPVTAPGGRVTVSARNVLHAGPVSVDAVGRRPAGRISVACERYVGTTAGAFLARAPEGQGGSIEPLASTRVFSSGRIDVSGRLGGRIWVSGRDTRLVAARFEAGGESAGEVRLGTASDAAQPNGRSRWHAATLEATTFTQVRANSLTGPGGTVVIGSRLATAFASEVQVCSRDGAGGQVEVSSSGRLDYGGRVRASGRSPGSLLLDPKDLTLSDATGVLAQYAFVDPNPNGGAPFGFKFGDNVLALSTGNVVVTDSLDSLGGTQAGAAYLYNSKTGALISTLTGSTLSDQVGEGGAVALTNGNYVVRSKCWGNGGQTDAGAATWASGTTGVSGAVSTTNSLVGSTTNDNVSGTGVTALTNGNYVVRSANWNGAAADVGAATWSSGTTGVVGAVSAANSLVGATLNDNVSSAGVLALTNGNYVVLSPNWDGGAANVGAATWSSGTTGITGAVSAANSLVGSTLNDQVATRGTALTNGNYVVATDLWDNGAVSDPGAATWSSGTTGITGTVSAANSLIGGAANHRVGNLGVVALTNGNYVVRSSLWDDGGTADVGAATFGNGATGLVGAVSAANSLVGSVANDNVSGTGVTALTNGNYVVSSQNWNGVRGAATWSSGTSGVVGVVSAANSLVGTSATDGVGTNGTTALTNGNYVVVSSTWNGNLGAATWSSGTTGIVGAVSAANSLVGTTAGDTVGSTGVAALTNGNYVVASPNWDNGATNAVGAATWGNGTTGITGAVSTTNSLVGANANDAVGTGNGAVPLTNGNYVVVAPNWDGAVANVGAATWGDGTTGIVGTVGTANSLVGSTLNDQVGSQGVTALSDGNYVVSSTNWDNGGTADAGALSLGLGTLGTRGTVSKVNSLIGDGVSTTARVSALNQGVVGTFEGFKVSVAFTIDQTTFAIGTGKTVTSTVAQLVQLLSAGTNVTLQASQDITINSPITVSNANGKGGSLTLIAGRSVILNANITTDDGDLTLCANASISDGVVDADRGAGPGSITNNAEIDAGTGTIKFQIKNGDGVTNGEKGTVTKGDIIAGTVDQGGGGGGGGRRETVVIKGGEVCTLTTPATPNAASALLLALLLCALGSLRFQAQRG